MGDILPPCASPLRSSLMVPYQKVKRSLKAVVSVLTMCRIALARSYIRGPLIRSSLEVDNHYYRPPAITEQLVGINDWCWLVFSNIPCCGLWVCFFCFLKDPSFCTFFLSSFGFMLFHVAALKCVLYWHHEMKLPFKSVGAKAKFMVEVIPVIVATALRLLGVNEGYFILLLTCTAYFHSFVHFTHVAYDIEESDVFRGLAMLLLVGMLNDLLVGALALIFWLGYSFYRYVTYCAPESPKHPKKEMELP